MLSRLSNIHRGSGLPADRIRAASASGQTDTSKRQTALATHNKQMDVSKFVGSTPSVLGSGRVSAPVRLDAYIGRSEPVDPNRSSKTLGRALALLSIRLNENKVKQTERYQRFHERKGIKKKRLRSERWRRRFKEGFKGMVAKVKRMRAQGC